MPARTFRRRMTIEVRRVSIALVVLVVLSPTMAIAADWYRCQADGEVRSACCCPEASDEETSPADAPDARAACCCDIESARVPASQPRLTGDTASTLAGLIVPRVTIDVITAPPSVAVRAEPGVAHPSSRAPPLFLAHCSLLL